MRQQVNGSTITRKTMFIQVREALAKAHGEQLQVPADRDLYRLAALLDQGQHTFGAATTRRSNDIGLERPFTSSVMLRPGEQVQIDTNTIDVMCRYGDGIARRAELTITVDVATRTILAGGNCPVDEGGGCHSRAGPDGGAATAAPGVAGIVDAGPFWFAV